MLLGMAYYPEHWPQERWAIDAQLMRQASVKAVRVAEFAWSRLEPREAEYDFSWLDQVIETMAAEGLQTILCTPTACPPAWMIKLHPEMLTRDANGLLAKPFGSRRHACATVASYQEHTRRMVTAMAERYGHHADVIGWQIDNELGNVYSLTRGRCYCEACRQGFVGWLQEKYTTLEALNAAWGTVFWSQEYSDWDQIVLPSRGTAGEGSSPSHVLDFYRFSSQTWTDYAQLQAEILRAHTKDQWISTNFAAGIAEARLREEAPLYQCGTVWFPCIVDWRQLSQCLDFPAYSAHVRGMTGAICDDYLRGIRSDHLYAILEGGGSRLGAYQLFARGGLGVAPFRWRSPRFGAESGVD